ncbi:hypothetical protein [Brachybacterium sacelli]
MFIRCAGSTNTKTDNVTVRCGNEPDESLPDYQPATHHDGDCRTDR